MCKCSASICVVLSSKSPQRIRVNTLQMFLACGLVSASVSFVSQ
jgi:hypothetical protein